MISKEAKKAWKWARKAARYSELSAIYATKADYAAKESVAHLSAYNAAKENNKKSDEK